MSFAVSRRGVTLPWPAVGAIAALIVFLAVVATGGWPDANTGGGSGAHGRRFVGDSGVGLDSGVGGGEAASADKGALLSPAAAKAAPVRQGRVAAESAASSNAAAVANTACAGWSCTCQGFSDAFDTWPYHWGRAPKEHRGWWLERNCITHPAGERACANDACVQPSPDASVRVVRGGRETATACPARVPYTDFVYGATGFKLYRAAAGVLGWVNSAETGFAKEFSAAVAECGQSPAGDNSVVLDIGANHGLYGVWAAVAGCRAFLFEPQPDCHPSIVNSVCANAPYRRNVTLVTEPVMARPGVDGFDVSEGSGCAGNFGAYGSLEKAKGKQEHWGVRGADVVAMVGDAHVRFLKVDVEGGELGALQHLAPLFERKQVGLAIVEVTTRFWEQRGVSRTEAWRVIRRLWDAGYTDVRVVECNDGEDKTKLNYDGKSLGKPGELEEFVTKLPFLQCDLAFRLPGGS